MRALLSKSLSQYIDRRHLAKIFLVSAVFTSQVAVAKPLEQGQVIPLYKDPVPFAEGMEEVLDRDPAHGYATARNVVNPTLTAFLPNPEVKNDTAVIVAPGGGFMMLSVDTEGSLVAKKLAEQGITAFVLKYRLEQTPGDFAEAMDYIMNRILGLIGEAGDEKNIEATGFPAAELAVEDGFRAVEIVRSNAEEWGLDPKKVGFIGFSAGSMLGASIALQDGGERPDFVGLIYGGLDLPVPADAPPAFIATSADDPIQGPDVIIPMFNAWREAGVQTELHIYQDGGHGYGLLQQDKSSDHWIDQFLWWMEARGLK